MDNCSRCQIQKGHLFTLTLEGLSGGNIDKFCSIDCLYRFTHQMWLDQINRRVNKSQDQKSQE